MHPCYALQRRSARERVHARRRSRLAAGAVVVLVVTLCGCARSKHVAHPVHTPPLTVGRPSRTHLPRDPRPVSSLRRRDRVRHFRHMSGPTCARRLRIRAKTPPATREDTPRRRRLRPPPRAPRAAPPAHPRATPTALPRAAPTVHRSRPPPARPRSAPRLRMAAGGLQGVPFPAHRVARGGAARGARGGVGQMSDTARRNEAIG